MDSSKKCAICGSNDLYRGEGTFIGHAGRVFSGLRGNGFLMSSVNVDDYVCGQCGYVMFFLKQGELDEAKRNWKPAQ